MPIPSNSQAASAKRRVAVIHSASTLRTTSAPMANAKGTVNSVYPEYSIGGWIIIDGWRSSGLRPVPSAGATALVTNGDAANTSSPAKNEPKPASTAVATGVTSCIRLRVKNSTRLDHSASSQTHSSSEPSCEDQTAAIL